MKRKKLSSTIEGYGYEYDPRKMIIVSVIVVGGCALIGYYCRLKIVSILLLGAFGMAMIPMMVKAQSKLMENNERFEQLACYMDHMIITFKRSPKILSSMESTVPMLDGSMKECVTEAIQIIKNDTSENVYEKAFGVIEGTFRTSRLRTLHRFLLNVERENSVDYQKNLDTLYYDIHGWVTRIYAFQNRLQKTKTGITISIVVATAIVAYFASTICKVSDSIKGVNIDNGMFYQIDSILYLMIVMAIYVFVNVKLNGVWLIEDMPKASDDKILRVIEKVESYDSDKSQRKSIITAAPLLIVSILGIVMNKRLFIVIGIAMAYFMATNSSRAQKSRIRTVKKEILKGFPSWLRDVSVNLHNMVVVNAIAESSSNAPVVMKPFISGFLVSSAEDPLSIRPYDEFFGIFKLPELSTSIKTLYSLQTQSKDDAQRQVNDLTERNQSLIAQSEELSLKDTTASISFMSVMPLLAMTGKLMCDMVIVLTQVLSSI